MGQFDGCLGLTWMPCRKAGRKELLEGERGVVEAGDLPDEAQRDRLVQHGECAGQVAGRLR
jgi:hypothetical protein